MVNNFRVLTSFPKSAAMAGMLSFVDLSITEADILTELADQGVTKTERKLRLIDNVLTPTQGIKITFESTNRPDYVFMAGTRYPVKPYVPMRLVVLYLFQVKTLMRKTSLVSPSQQQKTHRRRLTHHPMDSESTALICIQWIARELTKSRLQEFKHFLHTKNPHIVLLSEIHWFKKMSVSFKSYKTVRNDRSTGNGVAVLPS